MSKFINFCLIMLLSSAILAQGIYNNGANIVITSGTDVWIDGGSDGSYLTAGGGKLDVKNTGEIWIEGSWTNNNGSDNAITTTSTTGWVRFEENATTVPVRTIGGNAPTTFPYLEFNNSNGFTLGQNALSQGKIELTSGVITTGANYLVHSSTVAADLVSYSNAAFIYGNYRRSIASNTSTYVLPVGSGTAISDYYRADFINNNSTGTSYLDVSVAPITEGTPVGDVDGNIVAMEDGTAYTDIKGETAVWTITPNASTSPNYGLQLYIANVSGLTDGKFSIVKRADASVTYADWDSFDGTTAIPTAASVGRTVAGGYASKTGFTSFSKFAIAVGNDVLPIELLSFKTKCDGNEISIDWKTLVETNVSHFLVEKSNDGVLFFRIADVEAEGSSNVLQSYSFIDEERNNQLTYYRVKSIDFDGKYQVTNIVKQQPCSDQEVSISIYESFDNTIKLDIGIESNDEFRLLMVDALGKTILSTSGIAPMGSSTHSFYHGSLATGTYFVTYVGASGEVYTAKLYIQ
ncbi:MAG: hypothetical protein JKY42_12480 [Flavobacteriales bacterium]|nr:hypothetical protein [Flavobacteriales bacterium]